MPKPNDRAREDLRRISGAAAALSDTHLAGALRADAAKITAPDAPEDATKPALYRLTTRLSIMVARDGRNILEALNRIGALHAGRASPRDLSLAILRFILAEAAQGGGFCNMPAASGTAPAGAGIRQACFM